MNTTVVAGDAGAVICDALLLNLFEGVLTPGGATGAVNQQLDGKISWIIQNKPDCGKAGEVTVLPTFGATGARQILILGLGKKEDCTPDKVRGLVGGAARAAQAVGAVTLATIIHGAGNGGLDPSEAAAATVEGIILGAYRFDAYKADPPKNRIERLVIVERDPERAAAVEPAVRRAQAVAAGVLQARDMVNHPASFMTPMQMASEAGAIARESALELTVLEEKDLARLGLSAVLAVSRGSAAPPRLLVMRYQGAPEAKDQLALIGKGITFDSGGISLKPSEGMGAMKTDMAGGAAVIAAMGVIARLKPAVNVIGIVPCLENMPSGDALRPGDIIRSLGGKSIEIITTDAEGRLILADAVTYAKTLGATRIVDVATLTGACVIALGSVASAVIGNNRTWTDLVLAAGAAAGERLWELPAFPEYEEQLKSSVADLKNSGGREAGAITAALFIGRFAEKTPWVHIDIAGAAHIGKDRGADPAGATGASVRTLVKIAERTAGA